MIEDALKEIDEALEEEMAKVEAENKAFDMLYEALYGDKPTTER